VVTVAESDLAAHRAYLAGLDKESKGQTLWRKWEPLPAE